MKPMAFNLKDAKKVGGDKQSSTFQLKDGHQIKVAHGPLPALQRKQLERMPVHLELGGKPGVDADFQGDSDAQADADAIAKTQSDAKDQASMDNSSAPDSSLASADYSGQSGSGAQGDSSQSSPATPDSSGASGSWEPQAAQAPQASAAPGPSPQGANASSSGIPDVAGYVKQGQQAIREQQGVDSALAKANADNAQNDIDARQNVLSGFKQNTQDFMNQQKQFMQDYAAGKIDPKHYVENMDSSQKAGTAIGLFLGGFGSAFTHQGNPALDFLNKQIDRDIDAQKADMGKRKTLLEANQQLYHDNVMAEGATRAQLNDIYSHQVQLAAAKLGTPQAKAKADAAIAQWGIQNQGILQQNALRATALHAMQSGGQGLDAITLSQAGLIPAEDAKKEQSSIDSQKTAIESTKNLFDRLNKEQTTGNLLNPESYRRVAAANSELVNTVMNASASKRLTRESIEAEIKPLEINTTDTEETRAEKLSGVLNIIGKHSDPTPYMSKYAKGSLPQYPYEQASAPQVKTMGGVQYQKVPGGWKQVTSAQ